MGKEVGWMKLNKQNKHIQPIDLLICSIIRKFIVYPLSTLALIFMNIRQRLWCEKYGNRCGQCGGSAQFHRSSSFEFILSFIMSLTDGTECLDVLWKVLSDKMHLGNGEEARSYVKGAGVMTVVFWAPENSVLPKGLLAFQTINHNI